MCINILDDKFIKDFNNNDLVFDCHKISLLQNGTGTPEEWSGSGYLKVDKRNGIKGRLISENILNDVERFEKALSNSVVTSGKLYPESHFYSMKAEDINGRVWLNHEVAISFEYQQQGTIIEFNCDWIKSTAIGDFESNYVHMLFLDELPFPLNIRQKITTESDGKSWSNYNYSVSKAMILDLNVAYQREVNGNYFEFYITNNNKTDFTENIESKLIETIRFLSARSIDYSICEKVSSGIKQIEIRKSNIQRKNMTLFGVPLTVSLQHSFHCFNLFECYLNYCISSGNQDKFAFLSKVLATMQNLHNVHAESVALILSVNIESILQQEFKSVYAERDDVLIDDIKKVKSVLAEIALNDISRKRVEGLLGAINGVRAVDKLMDLQKKGILSEDEVQAWKKLRDASAHGGLHVKQKEFQQLLDSIYKCIALVYKLIFLVISYNGKYVDYSKTGWPVLEFDFSKYPEYSKCMN